MQKKIVISLILQAIKNYLVMINTIKSKIWLKNKILQ